MSNALRISKELEDLFNLDLCSLRANRLTKWNNLFTPPYFNFWSW